MRVQFFMIDESSETTKVEFAEAVLCSELYKEEVEREKNGSSQLNSFSSLFDDGTAWICPNITTSVNIQS